MAENPKEITIGQLPKKGQIDPFDDLIITSSVDGSSARISAQDLADQVGDIASDDIIQQATAATANDALAAKAYRDQAQAAAAQVGTPRDERGDWNPVTNVPALTANATIGSSWVPGVSGRPQSYTISVSGALPFAIRGYAQGAVIPVGSLVQHPDGTWFYDATSSAAVTRVSALEKHFPVNPRPKKWLIPFLAKFRRLLGGWDIDGKFYSKKWFPNHIPADALVNGSVTETQLAAAVINKLNLAGTVPDNSIGIAKITQEAVTTIRTQADNSIGIAKLTQAAVDAIRAGFGLTDGSVTPLKLNDEVLKALQPLRGKKLVTLGDSITAGKKWQPLLCQLTGMVWSDIETTAGTNGNPPMGIGGSKIVPEIIAGTSGRNPGQSIYHRAGYVHLYAPEVIILFGSQNDSQSSSPSILGTIADAPYTGPEVVQGEGTIPTFYSAYKGTLLKLLTLNPNAKVIVLTRMWNGIGEAAFTDSSYNATMNLNTAIKTICPRYSVQVIDTHQEVGITPYNTDIFYSDSVHPNDLGGERMARLIASKL